MTTVFAELAARSNFSFLEGASHPEELISEANRLGLSAIAIADRNGLYGSARAHLESKRCEQRVIVAAEVEIETTVALQPDRVTLLVEHARGYENLCKILTIAHADYEKGKAGIRIDEIAEHRHGLVLLCPADRRLTAAYRDAPLDAFDPFFEVVSAFGDAWALSVHRHLDGGDVARTALGSFVETRYGAKIVATTRPSMHEAARKPLSDVLHCIREKTTLDEAGRGLMHNAEARLKSPLEMSELFADRPRWVTATMPFAERCTFSLSELDYRFPSDELCGEGETPDQALRRLTFTGLAARYPEGASEAVCSQVEKELALIAKIKVAAFFLSVYQVVEIAREKKILCQGRGSAANSAVCYALGITAVDPSRSALLFERFLSVERAEPPDIDVDFEHERREEVIQALYEKYGRDRAAMVSEIIAYRGRSALRDVGKAFGLSTDLLDRLSRLVLHYNLADVTPPNLREQGLDAADERLMRVIALSRELEGFPRHLSIHVGGFVLSSEPLSKVAPIEPARKEARTVIPWDKDDLDALGFFKVDVLALGMLTAVRKCLASLFEHDLSPCQVRARELGLDPPMTFDPIQELAAMPREDPRVYEAISDADTIGVFQIESRAQMAMLPRLRPKKFYDLVIEVAIVRPGPIQGGMVHPYLRRRTGKEPASSPHHTLDSILDRTLGVPLFQEQVMQIAMVGAGYSAGEADQLRRDMAAWKKHGRLERHRTRLLEGFARTGIPARFGEALYKQVQGFGEYGFPESHAASFALIVYASSWQKTFHPGLFACALLNAQPMGFYSPSSIVQDAQRHGVRVLPLCALASDWDHAIVPDDASQGGFAMRLGLRILRGFPQAAAQRLIAARAAKKPAGVQCLVSRAALKKAELTILAEAGAFAALEPERRHALWRGSAPRLDGLFERVLLEPDAPQLTSEFAPQSKLEQLVLDYGHTGLSVGDHPMHHMRAMLAPSRVTRAAELKEVRHGTSVRVAGLVVGRQQPMTASGVTFISLEDETGIVNLVVQRRVLEAQRHTLVYSKFLIVHGRVERNVDASGEIEAGQGDVIHVLVHHASRIMLPSGAELSVRSRDYH